MLNTRATDGGISEKFALSIIRKKAGTSGCRAIDDATL